MSIKEAALLVGVMLDVNNSQLDTLRTQLSGTSLHLTPHGNFRLNPTTGLRDGDQRGVQVDAEAVDVDGETVYALLHASSGWLSELQLFRGDGAPIQKHLAASDFHVVHPASSP
jgi:hypothetical protein